MAWLSAVAIPALAGAAPSGSRAGGDAALIRSAMSAAPAAVARGAAIAAANKDGAMRTLRRGSNGFTCMPDNPATPGPDPMCMDANGMAWAMAWIGHKTPPPDTVGIMYMLSGGTDASNIDPYSARPSGRDPWVKTGPHLMVVGSPSVLRGYRGGRNPDTSRPYIMWEGTPYAHLMVPVR
jgi:hypothetical protein